MKNWKTGLAALAALVSIAAFSAFGVLAQSAGGDYKVGDRLAPPDKAGAAANFREISWDDLIPADWDPQKVFADFELDSLEDNDPRAMELMQRMREEWDRAPVVAQLAGQRVRIPGFVVPLESDGKTIREFLLVPYFGACVHVPPPPANQLIHVVPDRPMPGAWNMAPVWVSGVLAVARFESGMGNAGYQLRGIRVEQYEAPPPR